MFSTNIFCFSAKHSHAQSLLNELISINWRCDRIYNFHANTLRSAQASNLVYIFTCQLNDLFISESLQIISFDNRLENWEAMLHVGRVIKLVRVDSCDFDFITWSSSVDQIVQDNYLFLPWDSTGRNAAWSFLNCQFLVVPVNGIFLTDCIGTILRADNTNTDLLFCFPSVVAIERSFRVSARATSEVHGGILREYTSTFCYNTSKFYQCVQMHLPQFS